MVQGSAPDQPDQRIAKPKETDKARRAKRLVTGRD